MSKILCVEDEPDLLEFLVDELEDAGYETVAASNGQIGLETVLKEKPDLVLCDIMMPEMDGKELLATIRSEHHECADIPFIFLTALAGRSQMLEGLELGSDEYLTKPIDYELMLATVQKSLRQIARMKEKAQQEQVKLYKALSPSLPLSEDEDIASNQTGADNVPHRQCNIIAVGRESQADIDYLNACQTMTDNGHQVTRFTSGVEFLDQVNSIEANLTFINFYTDDIQAPVIFNALASSENLSIGPIIRVLPLELGETQMSALPTLRGGVFQIPAEGLQLNDIINTWAVK